MGIMATHGKTPISPAQFANIKGMFEDEVTRRRIEMFKETLEDWHPSYILNQGTASEIKLVRVTLLGPMSDGQYRVCVWGNDDFGMDFDSTQDACVKMYEHLCGVATIQKSALKKLGFVQA